MAMAAQKCKLTYIGKGLVATFMVAYVRFLAGMSSRVDGQCTALDEALVAVGHGAVVRTFVRMNAIVSTQVRLAVERLGSLAISFVCLDDVAFPIRKAHGVEATAFLTLPHFSHEQLKSLPPPGAMMDCARERCRLCWPNGRSRNRRPGWR